MESRHSGRNNIDLWNTSVQRFLDIRHRPVILEPPGMNIPGDSLLQEEAILYRFDHDLRRGEIVID